MTAPCSLNRAAAACSSSVASLGHGPATLGALLICRQPLKMPPAAPKPDRCAHPADISQSPHHQQLPGAHWPALGSPLEPRGCPHPLEHSWHLPPRFSHGAAGGTSLPSAAEHPWPPPTVTPPLSPDLQTSRAESTPAKGRSIQVAPKPRL